VSALPSMLMTLAQAQTEGAGKEGAAEASQMLIWLLVVIVALFGVAMVVVVIYRSRVLKEETTTKSEGLTLNELRRMHTAGDIDEAEFNRLKGIVTAQMRHRLEAPEPDQEETP